MIANTPKPPYYAVIFTSVRTNQDDEGYLAAAELMGQLAKQYKGFLGIESARKEVGITVSYWLDLDTIKQWKSNTDHVMVQRLGKERWYSTYKTRVSRVEYDYNFEN